MSKMEPGLNGTRRSTTSRNTFQIWLRRTKAAGKVYDSVSVEDMREAWTEAQRTAK